MPRLMLILLVLWMLAGVPVGAQVTTDTPPVVSLITLSEPNDSGVVTISGAAGAVFPGAQVAIRNLYTGDTAYTQAGITGTFSTQIFGPYNTPFWISAAGSIPNTLRDRPGTMPGGPGTIIYGPFPETRTATQPTTSIVVDGLLDDWLTYREPVELGSSNVPMVYALRNQESLYIGFEGVRSAPGYSQVQVVFTLDGSTYSLNLDPRLTAETATWRRLSPNAADLGTLAVAGAQDQAVELRVPLVNLRPIIGATIEIAVLNTVAFLGEDGSTLQNYSVDQAIEPVEEVDGTTFAAGRLDGEATAFYIAGLVAGGSSRWQALGQIDTLNPAPGESLRLQLDVEMDVPDLPESLPGLTLGGELYLQPVAGADGQIVAGGPDANNGLSSVLTPGGLPIDNLSSFFPVALAEVPAPQVVRRGTQLLFGLDFDIILPPDLPAGYYVPVFKGVARVGDGDIFTWAQSSLLGSGTDGLRPPENRLPLILNVGGDEAARLAWSLWQDIPSGGSRGVLPVEDRDAAALSNRVRFNSPTYILPPAAEGYPIEPYMLNQMPNAAGYNRAPMVPFFYPGGRLQVRVTRPDGAVDNLGTVSVLQGQLSTETLDETTRFGGQNPLDIYRLTTLDPQLTAYPFDAYGAYEVELSGSVEDVWGNRYTGGGTYPLLIAEPMQILPGALPGTPFQQGDMLNTGLRVSPAAAADVTVTVRVYPLDGGDVRETVISGTANTYGYFYGDALTFDTPGEYIIDYEARYTDAEGRLWAASQRTAGVIAAADSALIGHGERGLEGYYPEQRPAWFNTTQYAPDDAGPLRFNFPYHSGDVLWHGDTPDNPINPVIQVQDTVGDYAAWLVAQFPDYRSPAGLSMAQLAQRDSLPVMMVGDSPYGLPLVPDSVINAAYSYISAVRPGVTLRQMVLGQPAGEGFPASWGPDDPYNDQIGAGHTGDLPGDYTFLFGGAVVRNEAAGVYETAIYGALALVVEPTTGPPRIYPPFRGEGAASPLLLVLDEPVLMLFYPTGTAPGQILRPGETLTIAGHVAPALDSRVQAVVIDPDGEERLTVDAYANPVGYFYDPAYDLVVDKPGIWTVDLRVQHDGLTSAGRVTEPLPTGSVPGAMTGRYPVYVVPEGESMAWNDDRLLVEVPGALAYNFNFPLPAEWADIRIDHVLTMPGYVLESGPLASSGGSFSYQYNPTNLNRDFGNFELDARLEGPSISDPVTLTFVITGVDAAGRTQYRSRSFTIMYDRLMTLEG